MHSVLFVTLCLSTLCIARNAHQSRLLRWRGDWGCGLGQLAGCWKGLPAGDAHKGALPITGSRVAFNTTHTTALPSPCLRMALRLGGGAPCRVGGPAPPCSPPPWAAGGRAGPPGVGWRCQSAPFGVGNSPCSPGACTGTSPAFGGAAKLNERATGLGAASRKEAPDSSTVPSTIARARKPWNFLNGACGARPKGGLRPWGARNRT